MATISLCFAVCLTGTLAACVPRDYGKGSIVCVCNATYCDFVGPIHREKRGTVAVYESNKAGLRFHKTIVDFTQNVTHLPNDDNTVTVTTDPTDFYQKIIGFGGTFTDAAGINIKSLPENMQKDVMRSYYGEEGLAYNMARVPMASNQFSTRVYSYVDLSGDFNVASFNLSHEDYAYKIPLLKLAKSLTKEEVYLFGTPWSAPAWLKTNGRMAGQGRIIGNVGGVYYSAWTKYFVRFLQFYESQGLPMWGISVQNEPTSGNVPYFPYQCTGYDPKVMRDFIRNELGPTLASFGYGKATTKLIVLEDQRSTLKNWTKALLTLPDMSLYVSGVAVHWYDDATTSPDVLDWVQRKFPLMFLLSTEALEGSDVLVKDKVSLGNWDRAESYAHDIIEDLAHWISGWVDFNIALNEDGGPSWLRYYADSAIIVNATRKEFYKQPMYYAMGHFTKFLPRGSWRITSRKDSGDVGKLEFVAFQTPQNATVVVVVNRDAAAYTLRINDGTGKLGSFQAKISERSLQSLIWW